MSFSNLVWGAPQWINIALALGTILLVALIWAYWRLPGSRSSGRPGTQPLVRAFAFGLKLTGIGLLLVCLIEPLISSTRPVPGNNLFVVLADNSLSMQLSDRSQTPSRGQQLQTALAEDAPWLVRLNQDFEVRTYSFDTLLRPLQETSSLQFQGAASRLITSLHDLSDRLSQQPVAGVLLFTDGNATDLATLQANAGSLPPIYPVVPATTGQLPDLAIAKVVVSQSNFEAAPVTIAAEVSAQHVTQREAVLRLLDQQGKVLQTHTIECGADAEQLHTHRFLVRPEQPGIQFFTVHVALSGEEHLHSSSHQSSEATLINNRRLAVVDRSGGPFRILYVGGRPNWEYKFLRRALDTDDELQLVSLIRVAKQEPKFSFLGRTGEESNPLFRGFDHDHAHTAETQQHDEPVLLRLGTENQEELRGGFPKTAEELFGYHALILDDLEAAFFTQQQLSLIQQYVSQRGGAMLMLGGKDSFYDGNHQRSLIGEMLPVYLDRLTVPVQAAHSYRWNLTREGWLQPWLRLHEHQPEDQRRLEAMPSFGTLNAVRSIKPGAVVLAEAETATGTFPALVAQNYGHGRVGALLLGDLWRWDMQRPAQNKPGESDLQRSWRQTLRWLVSDVPAPLKIQVRPDHTAATAGSIYLTATVMDRSFQPLDNAQLRLEVTTPDQRKLELRLDPSPTESGQYQTTFASSMPGAYRGRVTATAADGSLVAQRELGWGVEPAAEEFQTLTTNRALLERLAQQTQGETIDSEQLLGFVQSLPNRKIPNTEIWTYPLWHQWGVLFAIVACFLGEWALRRWKGLP